MKKLLLTLLATVFTITSYTQISEITTILNSDISQGEKLITAYFTPMAESFGANLNNGWYNTAKPHSLGGFDLTFTINTVMIPNSAKTYKIEDEFGGVFTSAEEEGFTVLGNSETTEMIYTNSATGIPVTFDIDGGLEIPIIPLPMIQAGIGLIKNTAVDVRYIPMLNIGDEINVNLLGFGIKHDLLQWIPAFGDAIPMSLSLQAGHTSLSTELEISDQNISLTTKATTINLIASKKISILTGYAGIGYNTSITTFAANANFNFDNIVFKERVEIEFESNKHLRANIGLRLNITLLTIQADYTFAEYPTATLGLGISFR
ncbi:MAG: DUF6588 family protein [Bacteroidota bacterium]|nr:DUF6588 family protein [Bacteroidota bacterium]